MSRGVMGWPLKVPVYVWRWHKEQHSSQERVSFDDDLIDNVECACFSSAMSRGVMGWPLKVPVHMRGCRAHAAIGIRQSAAGERNSFVYVVLEHMLGGVMGWPIKVCVYVTVCGVWQMQC
jgi:hypothetical protein